MIFLLFSHCHVQLFATPWTVARQASLSSTISQSLLKSMSTESVMLSNHLILCHLFLLLPSIFTSIRVFSNDQLFTSGGQSTGASASASVLPMNIQGWFPLGLVWPLCCPRDSQESSPAPQFESVILLCLALFMIQLSHPYTTTGKIIALTVQTFISKVISLLFNTLSLWQLSFQGASIF